MATPGTRFKGNCRAQPLFCVILVVGLSLVGVGSSRPRIPSPSAKWERAIRAFEAADKRSPPPAGAVLFVGSSSIRFWRILAKDFPQYNVINRGFGGSQIADSTYYADRIVIPYRPAAIILHAGSNDISGGKDAAQVYADFRAFVEKVHSALPETPIAFSRSIRRPRNRAQADKQKETNGRIQSYLEGKKGVAFHRSMECVAGTRRPAAARLARARPPAPERRGLQNPRRDRQQVLDTLNLPKK